MRILHSLPAVLISLVLTTGVQAQDETGLPGDNFSLEGALEMFKKAENPGEFEKMLNTKENGVNNLDLNHDGDIDYVRVVNKKDGDIQLFILQALVSSSESQDIAVIELEKTGNDHAVIQIVGDEDIYGVSKIVEPSDEDQVAAFNDGTMSDRPHGPNAAFAPAGLVVNVWFWPSVRFVYAPYYTVWASPWRWYHYPAWWRPWRPLAWDIYQPICYRYRPRYVVIHTYRIPRAPHIYRPMRVSSVSVYNRNRVVVNNYRTNYHRNTPSRQFDRGGRNTPPTRQYDRNAPTRQYDRTADRNAPSRNFDRSAPSRNFDRSAPSRDADRNTPPRNFDRSVPSRDIDRNTPSRNFDRSAPSRNFDRSAPGVRPTPSPAITSPRRDVQGPRSRSVGPQRQFNRGSDSRPQGGQINRSPRSEGPQRSFQQGRPARQRS